MGIIIVIAFCLLGLILIVSDFFLISSVIAVTGMFFMLYGIHCAFIYLGLKYGLFVFGLSILVIVIFIIYIIRSNFLDKIALKSKIESSVIVENISDISVGDEGLTVSRLNPIGKVEVNNLIIEGKSLSKFIDEDTKIVVVKVTPVQLIVKTK